MPLIIDCYNLLHAPMPPELAGLDAAGLCRLLARGPWSQPGRPGVTVVCDGAPGPLGLLTSPVDEVALVYAGPGRSADDVIIELIQANSAPRRLTVVSSDHQIQQAARRRRARVCDSESFVPRLARLLEQRGTPSRRHGRKPDVDRLAPSQVEQWLEVFGLEGHAGPDDEETRPAAPAGRVPQALPAEVAVGGIRWGTHEGEVILEMTISEGRGRPRQAALICRGAADLRVDLALPGRRGCAPSGRPRIEPTPDGRWRVRIDLQPGGAVALVCDHVQLRPTA